MAATITVRDLVNGGGVQKVTVSQAGVQGPPGPAGGASGTQGIVYVDQGGNDANDGLTWATAKATIDAAITASSPGTTIEVGEGEFTFTRLTLAEARSLNGRGFRLRRDSALGFGHSGWTNSSIVDGTVLRSDAPDGDAFTIKTAGVTTQGGQLSNLLLIGPGSGTATGVHIGMTDSAVIAPKWENVVIANFYKPMDSQNVNEGTFSDVGLKAGAVPSTFGDATNANTYESLNIQRCDGGVALDLTCQSNVFQNPLGQANTGITFDLLGNSHSIEGGYFENSGGSRAIRSGARDTTIVSPKLTHANDNIEILSGARNTIIENPASSNAPSIINESASTLVIGNVFGSAVTLSGSITPFYIDPLNKRTNLPTWYGAFQVRAASAGSQANVQWADNGGTLRWQTYLIDGDGNLYMRDQANAHFQYVLYPGATDKDARFRLFSVLELGKSNTAGRPGASPSGRVWYDTDLSKPIFSDGTDWRDAAGTIV